MNLVAASALILGFGVAFLLAGAPPLRPLLVPLRGAAVLTYARLLPAWTYPYFDLLSLLPAQVGSFLRLRATTALISLSSAIFIRIVLGQLVPAQSPFLIVLVGAAFSGLIVLDQVTVKATTARASQFISLQLTRRLNRYTLQACFPSRRLQAWSLKSGETLLGLPDRTAQIASSQLMALLGDLVAIVVMGLVFLLITNGEYSFVFVFYLIYILVELLAAYARQAQPAGPPQLQTAKALLNSYRHYPSSYLEAGLQTPVSRALYELQHSRILERLKTNQIDQSNAMTSEIANDLVVVLILLALLTRTAVTLGEAGLFVAGLLILFRLTALIRIAVRRFFLLKKTVQSQPDLADTIARALAFLRRPIPENEGSAASRILVNAPAPSLSMARADLAIRTKAIPLYRNQLRGVSLTHSGCGIVALTGPHESGKTCLLRAIAGLVELQRGEIQIFGCDIRQFSQSDLESHVLLLSRDCFALPPSLQEILIRYQRADQQPESTPWPDRLVRWLGDQQNKLILLDDPELWPLPEDPANRFPQALIQQLARSNLVILATQDRSLLRAADAIFVLKDGLCKPLERTTKRASAPART
ncbi:ATP-binding cassette domain-containing protein [Synechococcus sp. RSCCF101]|uniref:ATP-binding cassette domain-containing protein n=1 Tax=Synechococcus sp. RSCCF101 TaxID=2511069 RepID=UPI001245531F|nr:ATP-binding cassette domain-containing protein [Synechococcus sp. RSCCF101]QEY31972.1 ATP-binding cassette domain-containing protein [Synechococcus sp. RSCCF101]